MRVFVARLCEALFRWAAPGPPSPEAEEPREPVPPPPPPPHEPVDIWPFEPYDNFVRPYVLSPEELYVHGVHGIHRLEVPA